ncbi:MAG: hypothetical protein RSC80_01280 [Odoribacter sp.]
MMILKKLLIWVCCICFLSACHKDNERDDTILDISLLTEKNWYYNAWLGDKYNFGQSDFLDVIRFEKGGILKAIDFGGRQEYVIGKWYKQNNQITMLHNTKDSVVWNVLKSGDDYIQAIVNAQGEREYTTDVGYLDNLTADAFLINEYTVDNRFRTYMGADVRGCINLREGALITAAGKYASLQNHGYYWAERTPIQEDYFDFDATPREVRFYLRIGKNTELKLKDSIYTYNLPERTPTEIALKVERLQETGTLSIGWNPFPQQSIYYRIEILSNDMNTLKPYFVSRIQLPFSVGLQIKQTTAGEINRVEELKQGETYIVRLSVISYEPDVDIINDEYSYANVQALTYYTKRFVWE